MIHVQQQISGEMREWEMQKMVVMKHNCKWFEFVTELLYTLDSTIA